MTFVNLDSDTFDITNEIPMQGPFTQAHVGGHQGRHVDLNKHDKTLISDGGTSPVNDIDDEYTRQLYGSLYNPKLLCHYTTERGAQRLADSIQSGPEFDISSFTVMDRPFFREESNILKHYQECIKALDLSLIHI